MIQRKPGKFSLSPSQGSEFDNGCWCGTPACLTELFDALLGCQLTFQHAWGKDMIPITP